MNGLIISLNKQEYNTPRFLDYEVSYGYNNLTLNHERNSGAGTCGFSRIWPMA